LWNASRKNNRNTGSILEKKIAREIETTKTNLKKAPKSKGELGKQVGNVRIQIGARGWENEGGGRTPYQGFKNPIWGVGILWLGTACPSLVIHPRTYRSQQSGRKKQQRARQQSSKKTQRLKTKKEKQPR